MTITQGGPAPQRIVFSDGLGIAAAIDDGDGTQRPCLIFQFSCPPDRPQIPPIKLVAPPEELAQLHEHIKAAVESASLHAGVTERPKAKCSGTCGRVLWDAMAERGVCRDCQPEDPPEAEGSEAADV